MLEDLFGILDVAGPVRNHLKQILCALQGDIHMDWHARACKVNEVRLMQWMKLVVSGLACAAVGRVQGKQGAK